jgi:hypothetical protein
MLSIRSLVENLNLFERNKIPLELKILGLALYIQLSSLEEPPKPYQKSTKSPRQPFGSGLESLVKG